MPRRESTQNDEVLCSKEDGGIAVVTINRPHSLNALSRRVISRLKGVFEEIQADGDIRAFIVTGAPRADGRPCFGVGADIKELAETGEMPFPGLLDSIEGFMNPTRGEIADVVTMPLRMSKFSIAAIDGTCTGGAIPLALSCDVRVCADSARVSEKHIANLGNIAAFTQSLLARQIGAARSLLMMIIGEEYTGAEALQMGFAERLFPSAEMMDGARTLARTIASRRVDAVRAAKAVAYASIDLTRQQALSFDLIAGDVVFDDSVKQAILAFARG